MTSPGASAVLTGRRLGGLLIGYLAVVIGVITLAPFRVRWPVAPAVYWVVADGGWVADIVMNVALFVPVGLALHRTTRMAISRIVLIAAAASVLIESLQVFIAPRYSTASDVAANALGAWVGASFSSIVDRRIGVGQVLVGRLLLDLPLMGVIYLLLPLLWLDGLSASGDPARGWLVIPLAISGALVLSAIARTVPAAAGTPVERNTIVAAVGWFVLGAVPLLRTSPAVVVPGVICAAIVAAAGQWGWQHAVSRDRRLEPQVVRVILPVMVAFVATLAADQTSFGGDDVDARIGILRWLERTIAFAVVAYLVAEWRGRREEAAHRALVIPVAGVVVVAVIVSIVVRGQVGPADVVVAGVAAAFGATLYRRQRDHIVALTNWGAGTG